MENNVSDAGNEMSLLVRRIKNGDKEAFMTVTRLYQKKVFGLAYAFFRNSEDALDVVQETFLRFHQKINTFKEGKNFQNWLLQIAKNICIDFYRKHHKRNPSHGFDQGLDDLNLPVSDDDHTERSADLRKIFDVCLDRLTEKQRMVFMMKHYNQMGYREIAQILDVAQGTVKSLHFKAVQNLRALTGPYLGRQS